MSRSAVSNGTIHRTLVPAIGMFLLTTLALAQSTTPDTPQPQSSPRITIVFDGSGSMWGQIDGRTKLEIAREALLDTLDTVSPSAQLGLIAYGHRVKGQCNDIETLVPVGDGVQTMPAIAAAVMNLKPKGKTPLTDAVRKAAEDMRYTEEASTVVLITDGIETCEADPCALAGELEYAGIGFTAHVVGFGLTQEEGQKVACLAEQTGGKFILAGNGDELSDALSETVAAAPPVEPTGPTVPPRIYVRVFDGHEVDGQASTLSLSRGNNRHGLRSARILGPDGEPVPNTDVEMINHPPAMRIPVNLQDGGDAVSTIHARLAEGVYTLELSFANAGVARLPFVVEPGMEPIVDLEYAIASVRPKLVHVSGGKDWGYGGSGNNHLHYLRWYPVVNGVVAEEPVLDGDGTIQVGEYEVRAKLGQALAVQKVTVGSGQHFRGEIVFNAALVTVHIQTPEKLITKRIESRFCAPDLVEGKMVHCRGKPRKRAQHVNVGEPLMVDAYRDRQLKKTYAQRRVTIDPAKAGGKVTLVLTAGERATERTVEASGSNEDTLAETAPSPSSSAVGGSSTADMAPSDNGSVAFYAYVPSGSSAEASCSNPQSIVTDFGTGFLTIHQAARSEDAQPRLRTALGCVVSDPTLGPCIAAVSQPGAGHEAGQVLRGPSRTVGFIRTPKALIALQDGETRTFAACSRESLPEWNGLGSVPKLSGPAGPIEPVDLVKMAGQ